MLDHEALTRRLAESMEKSPRQDGKPFTYHDTLKKYQCIRTGNLQELQNTVNEFSLVLNDDWVQMMSMDKLTCSRYLFCMWGTIASRVAVESGVNLDVAITVLLLFIRMMDETTGIKKVTELYGAMFLEFMTLVNNLPKEAHSQPIEAAISYINLHIYENITVEALSANCGYTPRHMNRLFQKELGSSVLKYITAQKLSRAAQHLQLSELSVGEISTLLGFSSQSYFTGLFRRHFQMTPNRYRERHRTESAVKSLDDMRFSL